MDTQRARGILQFYYFAALQAAALRSSLDRNKALGAMFQQIVEITLKVKQYDRQIQQLTQTKYPETQALLKVQGIGFITALTFVLTLDNKEWSDEVAMSASGQRRINRTS